MSEKAAIKALEKYVDDKTYRNYLSKRYLGTYPSFISFIKPELNKVGKMDKNTLRAEALMDIMSRYFVLEHRGVAHIFIR